MLERLLHLFEKYPLNLISHLSSLLPIAIGLLRYRFLTKRLIFLVAFFIVYFGIDSYSLLRVLYRQYTYPIQNLQPLFETWLVAGIYLACFDGRATKRFIGGAAVLCSGIILASYRADVISTAGLTTQRLFVTLVVLLYFNKILTDARVKLIQYHSMFWVSAGLLIYSAGTLFFSIFSSYLYSDSVTEEEFNPYWNANQVLYVFFCLMAAVGLWVSKYDRDNVI